MDRVDITISVTRNAHFRARLVSRTEKTVMELTVGGKSWQSGKAKEFHEGGKWLP